MPALKSLDLFSGMGGITFGLRGLGIEPAAYCEWDPRPRALLERLMKARLVPTAPIEPDVRTVSPDKYKNVDIVIAGFPCFPAGTLVATRRGYIAIEELKGEDEVLSHTGAYRRIVNFQRKWHPAGAPMISLSVGGHPKALQCTAEHPFFVRSPADGGGFTDPKWTRAQDIQAGQVIGMPVDSRSEVPSFDITVKKNKHTSQTHVIALDSPDQWFLLGYFLGDGWCQNTRKADGRHQYRVSFAVSVRDEPTVAPRLLKVMHLTRSPDGVNDSVVKYVAQNQAWWTILNHFGKYAHGKVIPDWVHAAPAHLLESFVQGYLCADGHSRLTTAGTEQWRFGTVSADIAYGIQRVLLKLGMVFCVSQSTRAPTTVICGRTVKQQPVAYEISGIRNKIRHSSRAGFIEDSYAWFPVRAVQAKPSPHSQWVFNMEIETDNSYVVHNMASHNCIGFSSAGKREGFKQQESGLFDQVVRLVRGIRPKFMFFENVPPIATLNDGAGVKAVIKSIAPLGYELRWLIVGACDVGAPHVRRRWFCLCVRKDVASAGFRLTQVPTRPFDWRKGEPSQRLCPSLTKLETNLNRACGNGVVPDAVRLGFLLLFTGLRESTASRSKLFAQSSLALTPVETVPHTGGESYAKACVFRRGKIEDAKVQPGFPEPCDANLVLDMSHHKAMRKRKPDSFMNTLPIISKPLRLSMWSTPRAGNVTSSSNALTARVARDIATQLKYEKRTKDSERDGMTSPGWLCWLMGYPAAWAKAATRP